MSEGRSGDSPSGIADTVTVAEKPQFSWLKPHAIFVIILVGPQEEPYGIQKDFLCAKSEFYQKHFAQLDSDSKLEHIVKLPDITSEIFGLAQQYMYTNQIICDVTNTPTYEALVSLWNLGHRLAINGLCEKTLDAMMECRKLTERIPATPLLIQVWKDTPEGSTIRQLLLSWAAEYMRASDSRAQFAKSLPQEVLSELVVAMSSTNSNPPALLADTATASPVVSAALAARKNVHYLEESDDGDDEVSRNTKKNRRPGGIVVLSRSPVEQKVANGNKPIRTPLPKPVPKRRSSGGYVDSRKFTAAQKLEFCVDLLNRMLSGPGFWTRLVGPFRDPVEPSEDGVPDYFEKVKRPMDLGTIKAKMDAKGYADDEEFAADVRQIFDNCFTYWKKGDPMWLAGEKLQKTFEEKYSHMNKWIAKMGGEEGD